MINPLRYLLNTIFPVFKNGKPEYKVGTTRVLEITFLDGKKNYIPEIYAEIKTEYFPVSFIGDLISYEWDTYSLLEKVPPYSRMGDQVYELISEVRCGVGTMEKQKAEEIINNYKRATSEAKVDYYFFES